MVKTLPNNQFGYPDAEWSLAKKQLRAAIVEVAKRQQFTSYEHVASRVEAIHVGYHDVRLNDMLGEISKEEDAAGRGLLSVLVCHKNGDQMPGNDFFNLAEACGYDVTDSLKMWADMVRKVHSCWL